MSLICVEYRVLIKGALKIYFSYKSGEDLVKDSVGGIHNELEQEQCAIVLRIIYLTAVFQLEMKTLFSDFITR